MTAINHLLTIPANAGRAIVEEGAMIARPLLNTERFLKFCQDRGIRIDRDRLLGLERLGLFAPVFRVRTPPEDNAPLFRIPVNPDNNWFEKEWAWDTTAVPSSHLIPETAQDAAHEAYYSVFHLEYLNSVLTQLTMSLHLDGFVEPGGTDWKKNGESWLAYADRCIEMFRTHECRRGVALLCQYISNAYYPRTRGDKRTIQTGASNYSDSWIMLLAPDWEWRREAADWDPKKAEALSDLTPDKLAHAYRGLADAQASCDPIEHWYQLTQFVAVQERDRLKGDALLAETFRTGAHMLRFLYKDLYEEELPHPNEVFGTIITHVPELSVREDPRRFLELVVNRYRLNPQPSLALILEGESERVALSKIFEEYYGAHAGTFGVELVVLGGVDTATGSKKQDRFRAILRLVDYLHHHQTFAFLILDDENYATHLKKAARKAKSIHGARPYVTRPEYIRIWNRSFEFDNFSCTEIARAFTELAESSGAGFTASEIKACKERTNPGKRLSDLYKKRTGHGTDKIRLSEALVEYMLSGNTGRKIENRPIIKTLDRVLRLAVRNPLPTMQEIWEKNQASKYFGKKK